VEARQVSRALRGELNRVLNAESANLQRAVSAAGRQLDAIATLEGTGASRTAVRGPARRRRAPRDPRGAAWPSWPKRLEIHRSAVQRALERLERLATLDADPALPVRPAQPALA
jgi:hypothetical protein